jgi:hypothetical protein
VQFARFVGNAVQGEFGLSLRQGRKVSTLIAERFPATLELAWRRRHRAAGGHAAGGLCGAAARPFRLAAGDDGCRCWACRCRPS